MNQNDIQPNQDNPLPICIDDDDNDDDVPSAAAMSANKSTPIVADAAGDTSKNALSRNGVMSADSNPLPICIDDQPIDWYVIIRL